MGSGWDRMPIFTPWGQGRLPSYRELMSGGLISYQGNQQKVMLLTARLIRTITSWGLWQVPRKVNQVCKTEVKQTLGGPRMDREQENSHHEWPNHTNSDNIFTSANCECMVYFFLVKSFL